MNFCYAFIPGGMDWIRKYSGAYYIYFGLQAEETMRKSFQQQLSDAIAVIRGTYKVGFERCQGQGFGMQALAPAWAGSRAHFEFLVSTFISTISFEGMFPQISGHLREFGLRLIMLTLSIPK